MDRKQLLSVMSDYACAVLKGAGYVDPEILVIKDNKVHQMDYQVQWDDSDKAFMADVIRSMHPDFIALICEADLMITNHHRNDHSMQPVLIISVESNGTVDSLCFEMNSNKQLSPKSLEGFDHYWPDDDLALLTAPPQAGSNTAKVLIDRFKNHFMSYCNQYTLDEFNRLISAAFYRGPDG